MLNNLKLKWKITFYFLLFSIFFIVLLWVFQILFLDDMYMKKRYDEIEQAIADIEKSFEDNTTEDVLIELEFGRNIFVTPTKEFEPVDFRGREDKFNNKPVMISEDVTFELEDGETLNLTFNAMVTPVDATVDTLKNQLIVITFIMIIASIILSIIISEKIAKPIEKINSSAKFLSNGEYNLVFDGRGFLEIDELSETLNVAAHELSKIDDLRKELIANISHDLRTPLSLIYSYAEVMSDFPDEISEEQPRIIMDEARRLTTLVNDLLNISQFESKAIEINKTHFNFTKEIKDTILRTNELVKNEKYEIIFKYNDEIFVDADKIKIMQAFYNLLVNAINYTGDDKVVKITQIVKNGFVRIEVKDSGEGVDENMLPYIWERYFKVDKVHKRGVTGTGLGLSIVKNIISLHDGNYGVDTIKNVGSTFWFEIKI